jgi:hypothetical protein
MVLYTRKGCSFPNLEIAINKGNASGLLGLNLGDSVIIDFQQEFLLMGHAELVEASRTGLCTRPSTISMTEPSLVSSPTII